MDCRTIIPKSKHIVDFENKYNRSITDDEFISTNLLKKEGIIEFLANASEGYYPCNYDWPRARLASALLGRNAAKVDRAILTKYKL